MASKQIAVLFMGGPKHLHRAMIEFRGGVPPRTITFPCVTQDHKAQWHDDFMPVELGQVDYHLYDQHPVKYIFAGDLEKEDGYVRRQLKHRNKKAG